MKPGLEWVEHVVPPVLLAPLPLHSHTVLQTFNMATDFAQLVRTDVHIDEEQGHLQGQVFTYKLVMCMGACARKHVVVYKYCAYVQVEVSQVYMRVT